MCLSSDPYGVPLGTKLWNSEYDDPSISFLCYHIKIYGLLAAPRTLNISCMADRGGFKSNINNQMISNTSDSLDDRHYFVLIYMSNPLLQAQSITRFLVFHCRNRVILSEQNIKWCYHHGVPEGRELCGWLYSCPNKQTSIIEEDNQHLYTLSWINE